jgi:hypothetical protein
MNFYQFATESPVLTSFLFLVITQMILAVIQHISQAINIRKHGWPPEHCNADGDLKDNEGDDK